MKTKRGFSWGNLRRIWNEKQGKFKYPVYMRHYNTYQQIWKHEHHMTLCSHSLLQPKFGFSWDSWIQSVIIYDDAIYIFSIIYPVKNLDKVW